MLNLRKKDELRNSSLSWGMIVCRDVAIPADIVGGTVEFDPADMSEDGVDSSSSVTFPYTALFLLD